MDRLKTFAKYAIWLGLFWLLSNVLIHIGINTTYRDIKRRGQEIPQGIEVVQIQATEVNGRVKLKATDQTLNGKYIKLILLSSQGKELGTQYIDIDNSKEIETYFQISGVRAYEITIVDEKGENSEGFMDTAMTKLAIIGVVLKLLFI